MIIIALVFLVTQAFIPTLAQDCVPFNCSAKFHNFTTAKVRINILFIIYNYKSII